MVVAHISQADIPHAVHMEETLTERGSVNNACITETCFDPDKHVEEPSSDREVGAHTWVRHAEVVKGDKVLDC